MQYKILGKNDYLINPLQTILHNREIDNVEDFLNVNESHTHHYSLLDNIQEAVECLLKHIKNKSTIYIQIDSDVDGYTSTTILYKYIKRVDDSIIILYNVHSGKEHGIILDQIPEGVNLVIIPDAGSNQIEEFKALKEKGIDVIVLDHHECEIVSKDAIIINNQICNYPNKSLCGAGVVYKFCKALDDRLNVKYADQYLDLVALGLIADVMDMRNLETRYYTLTGINQIQNSFFKSLLEKQSYSTKGIISITNIAFYIAPLINACIRFGSQEEKVNMLKAFLETDDTLPYKKRGEKEEIQEPISQAMARICSNIKTKQNNSRDKSLEILEQRIQAKNLLKNKILIVDVTDVLDHTLTGLVANQLANKHKKPVVLLRYNDKTKKLGGSGRGYEKGVIKDFKELLLRTEKFDYAEGHANAFGIGISAEGIIEANEILNEQLKDVVFEDIYEVDFIIPSKNINKDFVFEINNYSHLWGNGIEEPLIAITGILLNKDEIFIIGEKRNTIKFKYKDIEFIKFGCSETDIEKLTNAGTIELDIVGRCKSNEYNGNISAQIIISDYEVKQGKKFIF